MEHTKQTLLEVVEEVAKTLGVETPVVATFPNLPTAAFPWGININPLEVFQADLTASDLKAILAHEMGHIALGHVGSPVEGWEIEYAADDFAVKHYKDEFISSMTKASQIQRWDSASHPSPLRRIARIQNQ